MKKKNPRKVVRNALAVHAKSRKAGGPMKHRLEPRKGAKNDQPVLLAEVEQEEVCSTCNSPYEKIPTGRAMFCSNGFHCCRDCTWNQGEVIIDCGGPHIGDEEEHEFDL